MRSRRWGTKGLGGGGERRVCRGIDRQMSLCPRIKASRTPRDTPKQALLQTIRTKTHSSKLSAMGLGGGRRGRAAETSTPKEQRRPAARGPAPIARRRRARPRLASCSGRGAGCLRDPQETAKGQRRAPGAGPPEACCGAGREVAGGGGEVETLCSRF